MRGVSRREALIRMGSGAAGLVCLPALGALTARPVATDLDALAGRLCAAGGHAAFDVAAGAIRAGADQATMLGAVFLCGVRDIRPRPHGILHAVMMVESSFQLAEASPPGESWLPVLYNLNDLKESQDTDRREDGDWSLGPRRAPRTSGAEGALREFLSAMEAWDAERADRAIVGLLPFHDRRSLYEILWPIAVRCYAFIGHKMIYAAQIERVLGRVGWQRAEPALRSLVMTHLVNRDTTAFERSRELARTLPARWLQGKEEPEQTRQLLGDLIGCKPRQAQDLVVGAFNDGLGPRTVWDALRLMGSEIVLRRPGRRAAAGRLALLPVHALTVTSALGYAFRTTKLDTTKRLLILQAAAWLPALRDDMAGIVGLSMAGPGIDALGDSDGREGSSLAQLLEGASPASARLFLDREPGMAPSYLSRLRSALFRTGQEHHQHKYAAAMAEESRLIAPRWASRIMAPAVDYLANPADVETEVYRRSLHTLEKAGIHPTGGSR